MLDFATSAKASRSSVARKGSLRVLFLAAATLSAGFALPAVAEAADPVAELVNSPQGGKTLKFSTTTGGRVNEVRVRSFASGTYTLLDTGTVNAKVTAGAGCSAVSENEVSCPAAEIDSIALYLGAANDSSLIGCGKFRPAGNGSTGTIPCAAGELPVTVPALIDGGAGNDDGGTPVRNVTALCESVAPGIGLWGGQGDDRIVGGVGNDLLGGGMGSDSMAGGDGSDLFCGGPDSISSNATQTPPPPPFDEGQDTVDYSDHTDPVDVRIGDDETDGDLQERRNDELVRALQDRVEAVTGGQSNDLLVGSDRSDTFVGGPGADNIRGAGGIDIVDYSAETAPLSVTIGDSNSPGLAAPYSAGNDGKVGEGDNIETDIETLIGGSGNDTLVGSDRRLGPPIAGNSPCSINSGRNRIYGMDGDDTLDGRSESDMLSGGNGVDRVVYQSVSANVGSVTDCGAAAPPSIARTEGVIASIGGGASSGAPGEADSILDDIEQLSGTPNADVLTGSQGPNLIEGQGGNDEIKGGAGADSISGGDGDDDLDGQGDIDDLRGDGGNDRIRGGDGNDSLSGGAQDDNLAGGEGSDSFAGGGGIDVADYSDRLAAVSLTIDGMANDGAAGEADNLSGDVESLTGGAADDVLVAGAGNGSLAGGAGNDDLDGGAGTDTLSGGIGNDTVSYAARVGAVSVTVGSGANDGEAGEGDDAFGDVENVVGGAGNDILTGNDAANTLSGLAGSDSLSGNGSQDTLNGGTGDDQLDGGDGLDTVVGEDGNDRLGGGAGNDFLRGGLGDDVLGTDAGSDTLDGGFGFDTVDYSGRTGRVVLSIDGAANDGAAGEGDNIKTDVEGIASGGGDDTINSADGVDGRVSCGGGNDSLESDPGDVASACESVSVRQLGSRPLKITGGKVSMTRSGKVLVKVSCPTDAKRACEGSLTLSSTSRVSPRKKKRIGTIGRASTTVPIGKARSIKIRLSKVAKRAVRRSGSKGVATTARVSGEFNSTARLRIVGAAKKGKR